MKKKTVGLALVGALLAGPALAQLPQVLSIVVNGVALQGKALFYKGRVYVAVEDMAKATGGTYSYDQGTRTLQATIPQVSGAYRPPAPLSAATRVQRPAAERPWLKVVSEKKYVYGNNAIVFATIKNTSKLPARNLEVSCTFRGGDLREIGMSMQRVPELLPGQSSTLEFRLFEMANQPYVGPIPPEGNILVEGSFTRVSYTLKMDYQ